MFYHFHDLTDKWAEMRSREPAIIHTHIHICVRYIYKTYTHIYNHMYGVFLETVVRSRLWMVTQFESQDVFPFKTVTKFDCFQNCIYHAEI